MCFAIGINTIKKEDKIMGFTWIGLGLCAVFIVIN
ncbi:hypothetical protein VBD025_16085 [Virgibacillus flavescens]